MESLCQTYYDRRKYAEAEVLDRKLLKLHKEELGSEHLRTLDAQSRLIDSLVAQGKYYEARSLNRTLVSSLFRIGHLGTPRIAHTLSNDALIAEELGHSEEAESLFRQVLQLWLTYCGPRDKRTLNSMTQLGYLIVLTKGPGGDTLLRTAVQLHLEGSNAGDEEACRAMTNLSAAFWAQGRHQKACELAQQALEKFCPLLGNDHPDILASKVALARNMAKGGNLSGSERLFREVVVTESEISGNTNIHGLSNSSYGLAKVLMMRGCYDESIMWYLEVVRARASSYGWDHRYTLRLCYDLGECYQEYKQFDDAIDLYRNVVRRLWVTDRFANSYHPDIDDLESCITKIEAVSWGVLEPKQSICLKIGEDARSTPV
jgi:tetratricopeptide (TPR) repeat protein